MPQGRRKTPFSGKAKKEQLKLKKQAKSSDQGRKSNLGSRHQSNDSYDETEPTIQKINAQPKQNASTNKRQNSSRYALQFFQETKEELEAKKESARRELNPVPESELEMCTEEFFPPEVDFPVRPPWDFNMSREELDARENRYFREYVSRLEKQRSELSLFELNLETWRQLWRVLELSDIVLIIVDARSPAPMFPPSLYKFVVETSNKNMILVLNKIDLVPAPLVVAWKEYFSHKYPGLKIVMFTSFPGYNIRGNVQDKGGLQNRRRKGKLKMSAEGAQKLIEACKEIVKDEVDLTSWQNKIKEEMELDNDNDDELIIEHVTQVNEVDTAYEQHERYKNGILTIGCVGQPNVGKSSLMNAIMGRKVVSVSRTPGHTKHFQTIFLTPQVRLCDCPGLVFPSKVPKSLQVIMGSYPIAQLKEPFSVVKFIAERLDLVKLLRIPHPEDDTTWSAMDICDGWALRRGFRTARAARLDSYRAANSLLRMTLDGKITLCFMPPGYSKSKVFWAEHADVPMVKWIQARLAEFDAANEQKRSHHSPEEDDEIDSFDSDEEINPVLNKAKTDDNENEEKEDSDDESCNKKNRFALLSDS
ncbi:guanine nucleotide-binding protein-like 1 isoform X2 [Nilaparvata lugens]|uniref:guanine nucleotide-binding protein-like 1 isoform X1 n=1 Tax=Nilaparvata lugens TaxID=108931 RepID=UPI00193E294F|nr:guanine nucleotide-binding protein-like 1 isoform X1 [Nilaparvata lugens]XP_039287490.1 guanine nucleotide-binding protein-like 1 isoform X2 [Nilaparvata lugens]